MKCEIIGSSSKGNCIKEIWKPIDDFKNKYETLKDRPYKINGMGEYSINSETIDVYTLEP